MWAARKERLLQLVKDGLHALQEAPGEWLFAVNHRRGLLSLGFWGLLAICAGLPETWMDWTCFEMDDVCTIQRSPFWDITHMILGVLLICLAFVLPYARVQPNSFQAILCVAHVSHMTGSTLTLGNEWQFVMYSGMTFPFMCLCFAMSGVRIVPYVAASLINLAVLLLRTWPMDWLHRPIWASIICIVCSSGLVMAQQMQWRAMYDTEQELLVEKDALESLLSTVCDANCWTADDGDTVLRSDRRLDHIMGVRTEGSQLSKYLSEEDRRRLRQATTGTTAKERELRELVRLLPVTVRRPWESPVDVELFIVDRRGALSSQQTRRERRRLSFLIGFRLCSPDRGAAHEPIDLEAGLGVELPGCEVVRWWSGALSLTAGGPTDEVSSPVGQAPKSTVSASASSAPATLASAKLPPPAMHTCSRRDLEAALHGGENRMGIPPAAGAQERATIIAALKLICESAKGGALICIAHARAFNQVFPASEHLADDMKPALRVSDRSYMTERLRGVHISDARFAAAFSEFTEHSANDRWPEDHRDEAARGQPKDGAFLISACGYRLKCAVKLLGLAPPRVWDSVGTKHETAMACAWAVKGAQVVVRSDSGSIHYIVRSGDILHVCKVATGLPESASEFQL